MFKKMIKRGLRKGVLSARAYIRQLGEEEKQEVKEGDDHDQNGFAYSWLNSLFIKILNDKYCAQKPSYAWGVLHGAHLAKNIGIDHVSAIEFGVAGGNGLVSLERIAEKVEEIFGVGIDVYGFDTGIGLPKSNDYRDLPNLWVQGWFPMDVEKLRKQLNKAQLIIGLVQDTISDFIDSCPAPVTFISFDLDYYSSTIQAFKLLEAPQGLLLPRVHCYFDDIMGFTYSEFTGERLAIAEFNKSHGKRKISPIFGLKNFLPHSQAWWAEQFYLAHIFDHPLYDLNDGLVRSLSAGGTDLKNE